MVLARRFLLGTGILIGVYLLVSNATGAGTLLGGARDAYVGGVKVLQGR